MIIKTLWTIFFIIAIPTAPLIALMFYLRNKEKIDYYIERKQITKSRNDKQRKLISRVPLGTDVKGIILGIDEKNNIVYSPQENEGSIASFAPSGGGKTTTLISIINSNQNASGFIYEISGDIYNNIKHDNVIRYAPEENNTVKYSVFDIIDKLPSKKEKSRLLKETALLFFPDKKYSGSEKYFAEGGRDITIAALLAFYEKGLDFPEICKKIKSLSYQQLFKEIVDCKNEEASALLNQFRDQNEKNIAGCKGEASNAISLFADEDYLNSSNFGRGTNSIGADIVNSKILVLSIPRVLRESYISLSKLIVNQIMTVIDKREIGQKPTCLIILDELSTLLKGSGSIEEKFVASLQNVRKLNGRLLYLTQSIKDIDTYTSENIRSIIIDNTSIIMAMGAFDPKTREFFAELVGKEKKPNYSSTIVGISENSKTKKYEYEYIIPPERFADLPDDELYVIYRGGYIKLKKAYYFKYSQFQK